MLIVFFNIFTNKTDIGKYYTRIDICQYMTKNILKVNIANIKIEVKKIINYFRTIL